MGRDTKRGTRAVSGTPACAASAVRPVVSSGLETVPWRPRWSLWSARPAAPQPAEAACPPTAKRMRQRVDTASAVVAETALVPRPRVSGTSAAASAMTKTEKSMRKPEKAAILV